MKKRMYLKTLGCQMNQYDSDKMLDLMQQSHDFTATTEPAQADLLLINTCSVREKAQEKLFSELGRWRQFKQKNPHVVIAVGGCVASQEGEAILKRAGHVDIVFGPQTLHRLPTLYRRVLEKRQAQIDISFPEIEKFDFLPMPHRGEISAYVSIMEGCSKYCSYCIVPFTRGEEFSRPLNDVLKEVGTLASLGVKEIVLLGQNVNDYRGPINERQTCDLALLISYIASIDGIERIRYTTSHPLAFSDRLIEAYHQQPKLVNHLHLPVQSGSDKILSLMKRGYDTQLFREKIKKLRVIRPEIKISSDFIVGFPNESDQDFEQTLALVDEIKFDQSFSFIYSPRPGTPAAELTDGVSMDTKKQRLQLLQDKLKKNTQAFSEAMIGQVHPILVTGHAKKDGRQLSGRTECNRVVNFQAPTHLIGQMVDMVITEALPYSLRGRLVSPQHRPTASLQQIPIHSAS